MLFVCVVILYEIMKSLSICLFTVLVLFFLEENREKVGTSNKDNMYETYVSYIHMTLFFYLESINLLTFDTEEIKSFLSH